MMSLKVLRLFVVSFCVIATLAINPGLKVRVNQKGLNYIRPFVQQAIVKEMNNLKNIPDFNTRDGNTYIQVKRLRKTGLNPPTTSLAFNPGKNAVTLNVKGANIYIAGDWAYQTKALFIPITDSGDLVVSVKGLWVTLSLRLDRTSQGTAHITVVECNAGVGDVAIDFRGSWASFLYNAVSGKIESKVKNELVPKICQMTREGVNKQVNPKLNSVNLRQVVHNDYLFDFSFVNSPRVGNGFIESAHKGEVFWYKAIREAPFSPAPLPSNADNNKMVNIWMSDYSVNTMAWTAFTHDLAGKELTLKDLKVTDTKYFKTSCSDMCIGKVFPPLAQKYPNTVLEPRLRVLAAPKLSITANAATVIAKLGVDLRASGKVVLSADHDISLTVAPKIQNQVVSGQITNYHFTTHVKKFDMGTLTEKDVASFDVVANQLIKTLVLPKANEIGRKGIDLPKVPGLSFIGTYVKLSQGSLLVASDAHYVPQ